MKVFHNNKLAWVTRENPLTLSIKYLGCGTELEVPKADCTVIKNRRVYS